MEAVWLHQGVTWMACWASHARMASSSLRVSAEMSTSVATKMHLLAESPLSGLRTADRRAVSERMAPRRFGFSSRVPIAAICLPVAPLGTRRCERRGCPSRSTVLIARTGLGSGRRCSTWTGAIRIGVRPWRHSWPSGARTMAARGSTRRPQGPLCVWPALEERREGAAVGGQKRPRIGRGLGGRVEDGRGVVAALRGEEAELHPVERDRLAVLEVLPKSLTEASHACLAGQQECAEPASLSVVGDRRLRHGFEGGVTSRAPVHPGTRGACGRGPGREGGRIVGAGQGLGDARSNRAHPRQRFGSVRWGERGLGDSAGPQIVVLDDDRLEPRRPRPQEERRVG